MQVFVVLALASAANALVGRTTSCCFSLTASGKPGGQVGQLSDGQNRIGQVGQLSDGQNRVGQSLPASQYCIDNGAITDGNGRGCILTPQTTQLQCDQGASPTGGFSIGCNGTLSHNSIAKFYACPTGDHGGYNIYTSSLPAQDGCEEITLNADKCHTNCPPPTVAAPAQMTCPANLSGTYEFPHLIVPVDSFMPNHAAGTSYFGEISSSISTFFNFDIPSMDAGKTCSLVFLFPEQSHLETSSYTFSGNGGVDLCMLSAVATSSTSFSNAPACKTKFGTMTVAPGNSYSVATFPCPAGQAIGFELKASGDTQLKYFQDFNPSPIGLYITVCN